MRSERADESLLTKFLLGNLSEEEQLRVEDQALSDPKHLAMLDAAEADLIDDYVRGALSQTDRRAFEHRFLTSPRRRSKVEFARALAKVTDELKPLASPIPKPSSTWRTLLDLVHGWNPPVRFAGALALVACAGGVSWLAIENASMRTRVSALEAQRRDMSARQQGLQRELSQAQSRADNFAAQVQNRPSPEAQRMPVVAALTLMAGLSRAAETRVQELVIDRGAQIARITIQLEARDDYPRFRAELRTKSGRDVLTLNDLRSRRGATEKTVSLDVPATAVETGEYELALKGLPDKQAAQDVGYYYFRVRKQ